MLIQGALAEWLGTGLQNLVQRFESARHLLLRVSDLYYSPIVFTPIKECVKGFYNYLIINVFKKTIMHTVSSCRPYICLP